MEKKLIKEMVYGKVRVVENAAYQWAVIDDQDNIIVPFGKYGWIDGFDSGLARVRTRTLSECTRDAVIERFDLTNANSSGVICNGADGAKWGIINECGEEVLPVIYDRVWNFFGKDLSSTTVEKDGESSVVSFSDLNPSLSAHGTSHSYNDPSDVYPYNEPGWGSYDEYGGYNGHDDFTIDSAFDGDPEATWNID